MNINVTFGWQQLSCPVCRGMGQIGQGEHHVETGKDHPSNFTSYVKSWYDTYTPCIECGASGKKWAYAPVEDADNY